MAMRTAAMSPSYGITTAKEPTHLMRKFVLLALLVVAAALGIALWFRDGNNLPILLSTFFADASLGMIAGFGTRIVLRKRHWFIQSVAAMLLAVAGMTVLGVVTEAIYGVGPVQLEREAADQISQIRLNGSLTEQFRSMRFDAGAILDFSRMEWSDLAHLSITMLLTVMSLWAWRRNPTQVVEVAPAPAAQPARRRAPLSTTRSNGRARVRTPGGRSRRSRADSMPRARVRSRNGSKPNVRGEAKPARRSMFRRKPHIQLALVEEHRCPYCLDLVMRTDPRGVKECEVCGTLHHADCWAITGVCQVPHLNT